MIHNKEWHDYKTAKTKDNPDLQTRNTAEQAMFAVTASTLLANGALSPNRVNGIMEVTWNQDRVIKALSFQGDG